MRFGENYSQQQVPEWAAYYVPYNSLKRRFNDTVKDAHDFNKIACFAELYSYIEHSAKVFQDFNDTLHSFLKEQFRVNAMHCITENEHFYRGVIELLQEAEKLLSFGRVNEEAIRRVYRKIARYNRSLGLAGETRLYIKLDREKTTLADIDSMEGYAAGIEDRLVSGPPDMEYLLTISENYKMDYAESVCLAAEHEDIDALTELIDEKAAGHGTSEPRFQDLLSSLVLLSVSWHARKSVDLLLERMAAFDGMIYHRLMNQIIAIAGRMHMKLDKIELKELDPVEQRKVEATTSTEFFVHVLDHIASNKEAALLTTDALGRLPLHYAALYGSTRICEIILKTFESRTPKHCLRSIMTEDDKAYTPLHYAVISDHVAIAKLFVSVLETGFQLNKPATARVIAGTVKDLLCVALSYQYDKMVHLLATCSITPSLHPDNEESVLYVAARVGRADYIKLLIRNGRTHEVHLQESIRGWTPLFMACANGHSAASEVLVQAGAWLGLHDRDGRTAREHAAARGHVALAEMLTACKSELMMGEHAAVPLKPDTGAYFTPGHGYDCSYIVVNPGIVQEGKTADFLHVPKEKQASYGDRFVLEMFSSEGSDLHRLNMLFMDDHTHLPFLFSVLKPSIAWLNFRLHRANLAGTGTVVMGNGTTKLELGQERENLLRVRTVPILDNKRWEVVATITFTFVIAKPFALGDLPSDRRPHGAERAAVVGPAGASADSPADCVAEQTDLGLNGPDHGSLHIGENIIQSCLAQRKLGASLVQIGICPGNEVSSWLTVTGVQLTKDHVPVACSELSLIKSGQEVRVHDLDLEQFKHASTSQSRLVSDLGNLSIETDCDRRRAASLAGQQGHGADVQERAGCIFGSNSHRPSDEDVQESPVTLEHLLVQLPEDVDLSIEIKYPSVYEAKKAVIPQEAIEINTFVDAILDKIFKFGSARSIVLSSSSPEICVLLTVKQKVYSVMLIANAGVQPITDKDKRTSSLHDAIQFTKRWNISGIFVASELLVLCPRFIQDVKCLGLTCGSYGAMNNDPGNVNKQAEFGIDMVVTDCVGPIATSLESCRDLKIPPGCETG